ncbi:MAG TPA: hypothetical protein VJN90_08540 [Candidatus Acidoferrales bacterium]|nr:hypothetical protein [Candidatus Acidoferrales bacterium]
MIPVLMLMFSAVALVRFFLSYCRSILATYATVELSFATREVIGLEPGEIRGGQFGRLCALLRIAPNPGADKWHLRIVFAYFRIISMIDMSVARLAPIARGWTERESTRCAYFAAAALERRIASITP